MNARVNAASAASHGVLIRVESAQNLLARIRTHPLNDGVFADLQGVQADLAAAVRDLSFALAAIAAVERPTTADYLGGEDHES